LFATPQARHRAILRRPGSFTGAAFGQYASFTGGVVFGAQASFEFAAFDSAATLQTSTPG
jgi:hypothetical protein